jgi:hypothetical protein
MAIPKMPADDAGGSGFLKMADGESVEGLVVLDKPKFFFTHWIGTKSELCTGDCSYCRAGEGRRSRFRVNFIHKEGDKWVAKILEQGTKFWLELQDLDEDGHDFKKTAVKIKRRGLKLETVYKITASKLNVSGASGVKLLDLAWKEPEAVPVSTVEAAKMAADALGDIPF